MKQLLDEIALAIIQLNESDYAALGAVAQRAAAWEDPALAEFSAAARKLAGACASGKRVKAALKAFNAALESAAAATIEVAAPELESLAFEMDPELVESFTGESLEYLQGAESALIELEANPEAAEPINVVFRAFHTIKGTAAFLGLDAISGFAHAAESLLSRARDKEIRIAGRNADLSLRSLDQLRAMIGSVGSTNPAAHDEAALVLAQQLEAVPAAISESTPAKATRPLEMSGTSDEAVTGAATSATQENWTRIRTERLDALIDMIGELVIAQSMVAQDGSHTRDRSTPLGRKIDHAGKIVRELQDLSISLRMVPLKPVFQKMQRVMRDAAQRRGKQVELIMDGSETEVDRNMVDVLGDPLVHMIRNAVDHGIEAREDRIAAGKPETARIWLSAYHAGGDVVVEIRDDGRGIDTERVRAKALARGLIDADRFYPEQELLQLLFAPGFSTAETVTDLSGRGVGLDVVRRNIESMRGSVSITSEHGKGTRFVIRMPLTLAMTDGMLIRIGGERFILPTASIELSFRPERAALSTVGGRGEMVLLRDDIIPIIRLHQLLGVKDAQPDPCQALLVVVATAGGRRHALLVDELLGQQLVIAKPVGNGLARSSGVSGGAILGDGRVGLIIDVADVLSLSGVGRAA
jgi:two-component system, chemotaxis family, sensor kinase CheA